MFISTFTFLPTQSTDDQKSVPSVCRSVDYTENMITTMTTVPGNYVTDMTDAVSAGPQARNSRLRQEDIDSMNASKRALHMELVSWSTLRKSFSVEPLLESSQKKIDLSHCSEDGNKVSTQTFFCFLGRMSNDASIASLDVVAMATAFFK